MANGPRIAPSILLCLAAACGGQTSTPAGSGSAAATGSASATAGGAGAGTGTGASAGAAGAAAPSGSQGALAGGSSADPVAASDGGSWTQVQPAVAVEAGTVITLVDSSSGGSGNCPCTRRPGLGNSFMCPAGVGQSTSMVIGASGGKVVLAGQEAQQTGVPFSLEIPPSALGADTLVTVTESATPPPANFIDYSPIYLVEPAGQTTTVALPIVVGWANKSGTVNGPLAIYAGPGVSGPFQRVAHSYVNAGFMQGSVKGFGAFFSGYPKTLEQAGCP